MSLFQRIGITTGLRLTALLPQLAACEDDVEQRATHDQHDRHDDDDDDRCRAKPKLGWPCRLHNMVIAVG